MFSREEASRIKQEFWTAFGRYMSPVPSAEGLKINWINYHTGIKDLFFRMNAGPKVGTISISIEHNDAGIRELYFEQLSQLRLLFESTVGEEWMWQPFVNTGEKTIAQVSKELTGFSVFNRDHWPDLISFFKPRIIALDEFWQDAKYTFGPLLGPV